MTEGEVEKGHREKCAVLSNKIEKAVTEIV